MRERNRDPRRSEELLEGSGTDLDKGGKTRLEVTKGDKGGTPKTDSVEDARRGVTGREVGVSPWTRPSSSQGQTLTPPPPTRRKPAPGSAPLYQSHPEGRGC